MPRGKFRHKGLKTLPLGVPVRVREASLKIMSKILIISDKNKNF